MLLLLPMTVFAQTMEQRGKNLGEFGRANFANEQGIKNTIDNLKTGKPMTTIEPTEDTFSVQLSCQVAETIMTIEATNKMISNPTLKINYADKIFTTGAIDSVCTNGFVSDGVGYTWHVEKNQISTPITNDYGILGTCIFMKEKTFITSFQEYFMYISHALNQHLSKLGHMVIQEVNGNMQLEFSSIVAGACDDEGALQTSIPQSDVIAEIGKTGEAPQSYITQARQDETYKDITDGSSYEVYQCESTADVELYTEDYVRYKALTYTGNLPNITHGADQFRSDDGTWFLNNGTDIGIYFRWREKKGGLWSGYNQKENASYISYADKIQNDMHSDEFKSFPYRIVSTSLLEHSHNIKVDFYTTNASVKVSGSYVHGDLPYTFTVNTEQHIVREIFNVFSNNGCNPPDKCSLDTEYVCDMHGNNCVQTVKDGIKTATSAKKICMEIKTSQDIYTVCADGTQITATGQKNNFARAADYFTTKRSYNCGEVETDYDFSAWVAQGEMVTKSAHENDGTIEYINEEGQTVSMKSSALTIGEAQCVLTCKVKAPIDNSDEIMIDGKPAEKKSTTPIYSIYTKECAPIENSEEYECVAENDEIIVDSACACPSDFNENITKLMTIEAMADGMVCSE